jgi:SecD/SecF fusion protein
MAWFRLLLAISVLGGVWYAALDPILKADGELDWRWGMDFNGGVQLVYQLRQDRLAKMGLTPDDVAQRMDASRQRLRERVVAFHTEETKVAILGEDRILVEIPGVQDIQGVKRQIGKPQYLTVHGVNESSDRIETGEGWYVVPEFSGGGSVRLSKAYVRGEHVEPHRFQPMGPVGGNRFGFVLPLSDEGQQVCSDFTTEYYGKEIAVVLDDQVHDLLTVQDPGIREPQITTGTADSARRLLKLLGSGPLPLPFELVQERAVSPVLAAMRQSSLQALSAGVVVLILFFGLTYAHRPYFLLMALMAVALEVGLFVIIANKHWIRISLPQLAGLALLIGMSVDAFILVFEHVERELEEGSWEAALKASQRAFQTEIGVIFWAATTTVLTLGGLFFVEGLLHEYFILLALGVAISLSAAIYLRLCMSADPLLRVAHWLSRQAPFAPWVSKARSFDLIAQADRMARFYKVAVPASLVVIVFCVATGNVTLGIDFSGGAQLVVETDKEVDTEAVRKLASDVFDSSCEVQFSRQERHYAIRIAEVNEELASRTKESKPDAGAVPLEDQLIQRLEKDLAVTAKLIEVELLGQAAALDNTLSSLGDAAWGLLVLFLLCALLYISLTVPFWIVLALAVDVTLVLGIVLLFGLPIDYPMIAAFLTFAGYSINDSIVVCHEIRAVGKPNMPEAVKKNDPKLAELIRNAVAEGLKPITSRVFLTSITTMLTMVPLLFCDGVLRTFGVIFVFGTLFGTLSSVYVVGVNARDVVMGDTQVL